MHSVRSHDLADDRLALTRVHAGDDGTILDASGPIGLDDRFPIASVTKTLTALVVARLAVDGVLGWSDPIAPSSGITWRSLLNHTSRLPFELRPDHWFSAGPFRDELTTALSRTPSLWMPPLTWHYSNAAYGLAALRLEQLVDQPFADLLLHQVLAPLDMHATSFSRGVDEPPGVLGAAAPAGDLRSTTRDLVGLAAALAGHRPDVVSGKMIELLLECAVADGSGGALGAGLRIHREGAHLTLMSSGTILGHTTCVLVWPRRGASVLVANAAVDHRVLRDEAVERWQRREVVRSWWLDGQEVMEVRSGNEVELLIAESMWPFPLFAGRARNRTLAGLDWQGDPLVLTDRGSELAGADLLLTAVPGESAFRAGADEA
ncbi:serine hydrolase domain-containing protein [Tenggerimyces flavus]|uniref:Serine hydrolase domain-containing protein n=1 Tax=Tenggerimyces flavus TaxID=1708749 RepID=A0ABV7YIZ4_9ACTN|nr:serine hydrolase domain-containing protein [Tenggerimyces flavus]MBM7789666.1 hypothetical protein [Tenggerimyces flavus]